MRGAERSQLVGAAGNGSSLLSLRAQAQAMLAKSSSRVSGHKAVRQRVMPNPSINRTANGGKRLLAFANAQPPLSAGYLKRWASLGTHAGVPE